MSSQSCINKYTDERDQRGNDSETEKLVIMSSQSCIDKDYNERDQRGDDIETQKLGIMSSQSCIEEILMKYIIYIMMRHRHLEKLFPMVVLTKIPMQEIREILIIR